LHCCLRIATGELRSGIDPDIALDALHGPFYHRLLVPYRRALISAACVDSLVDIILRGLERLNGQRSAS
jgi:hypothetical protein